MVAGGNEKGKSIGFLNFGQTVKGTGGQAERSGNEGEGAAGGYPSATTASAPKKRPIKELLAEYERKRIEFDKENELGKMIGPDGTMHENLA